MVKTAIVFEGHSDDSAVGVGGTLMKLKKEDYYIIKVIFSAGQKSHPHYREDVIIKQRIQETERIGWKFGINQNIFFGLEDNKLKEEIINKNVKERIRRLLKKYHAKKIFVNSSIDPHPDHKAVYHAVIDVINDLDYKADVYTYEVWNIIKDNKPVVYSDISQYFGAKITMMKSFRSQWVFMYPLILAVYFRARFYGFKNDCMYAEKFYKIR